jgi:sirohydrochlorin cobaltochelatase
VSVAFLELVEPTLAVQIEELVSQGVEEIIVQPFLLADGRHSVRDIPEQVLEASRRHPELTLRVGAVLGVHESLADLVLLRADEAVAPAALETAAPDRGSS